MQVISAKVSKAAAEAIGLIGIINDAQERLDRLKVLIRNEASRERENSSTMVEFNTPSGVVSVVFPKDAVNISTGANLLELKPVLTTLLWNDLFSTEIVLASDFSDKVARLPRRIGLAVKGYVTWSSRAPRVLLPR